MIVKYRWHLLGAWFLLLIGCGTSTQNLPPVVELKWQNKYSRQETHRVVRGDTLYSIAFRYDKDYRGLAAYNRLASPYTLYVGQIIYLQYLRAQPNHYYAPVENRNRGRAAIARPGQARPYTPVVAKTQWFRTPQTPRPVTPQRRSLSRPYKPYQAPYRSVSRPLNQRARWVWPVQGRVVANFLPEQGKKGIDIAAQKGKQIVAAAPGIVAYSGSGLSGYGNLIIIKHEGQFLTAYGNNLKNYVKEGQHVKVGQVIAEIGMIGRKFWGVHFEIRKAGQPVNPMGYLR